jgi:hypothetical protein
MIADKLLEGACMERAEAIRLLRGLVILDLAQPSFVSLNKNERDGKFSLVFKGCYDPERIRTYIEERNLSLSVDKDNYTCTIYRD